MEGSAGSPIGEPRACRNGSTSFFCSSRDPMLCVWISLQKPQASDQGKRGEQKGSLKRSMAGSTHGRLASAIGRPGIGSKPSRRVDTLCVAWRPRQAVLGGCHLDHPTLKATCVEHQRCLAPTTTTMERSGRTLQLLSRTCPPLLQLASTRSIFFNAHRLGVAYQARQLASVRSYSEGGQGSSNGQPGMAGRLWE